jgi:hypothetical protein
LFEIKFPDISFMTDGQLANFDEFQGDMDGLDTWSRG